MTRKPHGRLAEVLDEVEALVKRMRKDLRRAARDTGLMRTLEQAAAALRKQAALGAGRVERYVRALRLELAKAPPAKHVAERARVKRAA